MNVAPAHHDTYITKPDDAAAIVREAIPPPAQPMVEIPDPFNRPPGSAPNQNKTARQRSRSRLYGMPLAWRGLNLLSATFGMAGIWYVTAWAIHGRLPLIAPTGRGMFSAPQERILPPTWLMAILGALLLLSLFMMLVGTQDATQKLTKHKESKDSKHGPGQPGP